MNPVEIAKKNLKSAPKVGAMPKDIGRWDHWREVMAKRIPKLETRIEVLHVSQHPDITPFGHRTPASQVFGDVLAALLTSEFRLCLDEIRGATEFRDSIPDSLVEYKDNQKLSNMFFWHFRTVMVGLKHIKPKTILEIGSGNGAVAKYWLQLKSHKIDRYILVDLPESLFFADVCLRDEFPEDVGYWKNGDPGTKIVLIPTSLLEAYKQPVDLILNIGSMQEMSEECITYYMNWLDAFPAKFFYSLNYLGQPIANMCESRNYWAPRPSTQWTTRYIDAEVPLYKMMSENRWFAEIIYEKTPVTPLFSTWAGLHGQYLNRRTFVDGLELLRQDLTVSNVNKFINVLTRNEFDTVKEVYFLLKLIKNEEAAAEMEKGFKNWTQ